MASGTGVGSSPPTQQEGEILMGLISWVHINYCIFKGWRNKWNKIQKEIEINISNVIQLRQNTQYFPSLSLLPDAMIWLEALPKPRSNFAVTTLPLFPPPTPQTVNSYFLSYPSSKEILWDLQAPEKFLF